MGKSSRNRAPKACQKCRGEDNTVLYRVRENAQAEWQLLCKRCQAELKESAESYQYGGTWKQQKRN